MMALEIRLQYLYLQSNQIKNMGNTDLRSIQAQLETEYKALRKYYDDFYGQITLLQQKGTPECFARIDKVLFNHKGSTSDYLLARKQNPSPLLVPLKAFYCCRADMCSETDTCIFLFQFSQHTLFKEVVFRQKCDRPFQLQELLQLFMSMTAATSLLKICNSKELLSNSSFMYKSVNQLQILEPLLCYKNDNDDLEFNQYRSYEEMESRHYYISPESYQLLRRKETLRAKEMALTSQSLIFTLGLNFLECAILSDLTDLYDPDNQRVDSQKLAEINKELVEMYGDDVYRLLVSMTENPENQRPTLQEIKEYLKIISRDRNLKLNDYPIPAFLQFSGRETLRKK